MGVTISVGVAGREPDDASHDDLMLRVDDRLYRAKTTRNAVWLEERVGAA